MTNETTTSKKPDGIGGQHERVVINPYRKFTVLPLLVAMILLWPTSYLIFEIDLGWATFPAVVWCAAIFFYLLKYAESAQEKANQFDRDSEDI